MALLAGYSFPVHLINSGGQSVASISTPLKALRALLGDERVIHARGCDIIAERRAGAPVFPGELKAFARVPLAAGACAQVRVRMPVDMLNFTDGRGERIVEPGDFDLMIGSSSRDILLSDTVTVTGNAVRTPERDWRMVSEVEVLS
ncbi:hypothetical protein LMG28614_05019 [Paraburkholderia ultramafica]|uniref:Fibronectin type III-like domain-containing protein n=1 Tax=Paraburkholderia ultramafica TaxID=1544867 RepID=A0A6S7CWV7_9BURK|nr:fibronectin type III-like domain-contianing protein [Paraburkholderia ultramafica]CAB3799663.1 hypothetical protein LMG28614_05019 [Paraburkholderia ultramafica]